MNGSEKEERAAEYVSRAWTLLERGQSAAAGKWADRAVDCAPFRADGYRVLGSALTAQEQYARAEEAFRRVLSVKAEDPQAMFEIGSCRFLQGDYIGALEYFRKAEKEGYENGIMSRMQARIYRAAGEMDLADRCYQAAIRSSPLYADIRIEKAACELASGRPQKALATLEDLQECLPGCLDGLMLRVEVLCRLDRYPEAAGILEKVLEEDPDHPVCLLRLAELELDRGEISKARELAAKAEKQQVDDVLRKNLCLLKARLCLAAADQEPEFVNGCEPPVAKHAYDKFASVNSQSGCKTSLREAGKEREGMKEARCVLKEFYRRDPDEETAYLLMLVSASLGDYDEALALAEKMREGDSRSLFDLTGRMLAAFLHKRKGETDRAEREWKSLASLLRQETLKNPGFYEGYIFRLLCHRELGEKDKAEKLEEYLADLGFSRKELGQITLETVAPPADQAETG